MVRQLHTQFTCTELEDILTVAAQLWCGILNLDDINDATAPAQVDLWERAAKLYVEQIRETHGSTRNDLHQPSSAPG